MLNFYYIISSVIIIGITYIFINKYSKKIKNKSIAFKNSKLVKNLKKKYKIKSTEKTNQIKQDIHKNVHEIDVLPIPNKFSNSLIDIEKISKKTVECIKSQINIKSKNIDNIIISFLNTKILFNRLFFNENGNKLIYNVESFTKNYKKILNNEHEYNIVIKLSNNIVNNLEDRYIIIKRNNLIKITNYNDLVLLYSVIVKNKIFLLTGNKKNFICMADFFESYISKEQIKKLFFNEIDLSDLKNFNNYESFTKFNYITVIYLVNTEIM